MCIDKVIWHPSGSFEGAFDGFRIFATRLIAKDGQIGWRTRSHTDPGDDGMRVYLVVAEQFYKIPTFTMLEIENAECLYDKAEALKIPPDAERQAILQALAEWST